jgi:transposase
MGTTSISMSGFIDGNKPSILENLDLPTVASDHDVLDKALEHQEALERHLTQSWRDLFGAKCDLLLYDLTSTYFEGQAAEIPAARRGYSRDSRPDALQLILAMVVTEEGLPLSYEVFEGNRADVATLEEILDSVERKKRRARQWAAAWRARAP